MANRRAKLKGELGMVVKHEIDIGTFADGHHSLSQAANLIERCAFGTKLHQVRATVT